MFERSRYVLYSRLPIMSKLSWAVVIRGSGHMVRSGLPVGPAPGLSPYFTFQMLRTVFCNELGFFEQPSFGEGVFFRSDRPIADVFRQVLGVPEYLGF